MSQLYRMSFWMGCMLNYLDVKCHDVNKCHLLDDLTKGNTFYVPAAIEGEWV